METCSCSGESVPPHLRDCQLEGPDGGCRGEGQEGCLKLKSKALILKSTDYMKLVNEMYKLAGSLVINFYK